MYDITITSTGVALTDTGTGVVLFTCDRGRFWAKLKEVDGTAVGVLLGYGDDWHFEITDITMTVNFTSGGAWKDNMVLISVALTSA